MITKLSVRNFKLFDDVEIELGPRVVMVGPNNAGKTSALQALALWDVAVKRWIEKRGGGDVPEKRAGVTINRRDLIAVPIPAAKLLWRDLHVREGVRDNGRQKTHNVLIEIRVEGVTDGELWTSGVELDYANEESFYCRPVRGADGAFLAIPEHLARLRVAYLPPMSGLVANEMRLDEGAVNVRIGEGRTADVLRNLCNQVLSAPGGEEKWSRVTDRMKALFGIEVGAPEYIKERGEIVMSYRRPGGPSLDIASSGRGQQQTLLLLAHMHANPGAVMLLDEPDAHLEVLRQRQIYQTLSDVASETDSQILAASHSEVLLNEAADRDIVIAFVGKPHRIDDRGAQVLKALKEIGFDQYHQAEVAGWVLYLEGSTDLGVLRAFAKRLDHPVREALERPFVHYVGNQPRKAQEHFHGLREAKRDLVGVAVYDRLDQPLPADPHLRQLMWRRRELENYLCQHATLMAYAATGGSDRPGELFAGAWATAMERAINTVEGALRDLSRPSPWGPDVKATDDFLDPLFKQFFQTLGLPNLMRKTDYHTLAPFVAAAAIDAEIVEKLDAIADAARAAAPRTG